MRAIGCDLLALPKFYKTLNAYDESTLTYLFTANEFELAKSSDQPLLFLSISFSGKEAVSKALGKGMTDMSWNDIEILPAHSGVGTIRLYKKARVLADFNFLSEWVLYWMISGQLLCVWVDAS